MRTFVYGTSVSFLAAMLLTSGVGHLLRFARFRTVIRSHGLVTSRVSLGVASIVTAFELTSGVAFVAMLLQPARTVSLTTLAAASAAAGALFLLYLRKLLRQPAGALSCGCSPLPGPLTSASLAPSSGLVLASFVALGAAPLERNAVVPLSTQESFHVLSVCWGITLALLVLVVPAVALPRHQMERHP